MPILKNKVGMLSCSNDLGIKMMRHTVNVRSSMCQKGKVKMVVRPDL